MCMQGLQYTPSNKAASGILCAALPYCQRLYTPSNPGEHMLLQGYMM